MLARLGLAVLLAGAGLAGRSARADHLVTLYRFTGTSDGAGPLALRELHGTLYGTTHAGGPGGCCATIFGVDRASGGESTLYSLPSSDGEYLFAGLTKHDGILYGTAAGGGAGGEGTIFKFDPVAGVTTVLHGFTGGPNDGASPFGAVIYQNGALYGTTESGGTYGWGTVFRLDLNTGVETVLYSFRGGTDGATPYGSLAYGGGAFYGTTMGNDVSSDYGTVYRLDLTRTGATETVLHHFAGGRDGAYPDAAVTYVGGVLYGTTQGGDTAADDGTVFELEPMQAGMKETVLHAFTGGADGLLPEAPVIFAYGALYGTTVLGGGGNCAYQNGCGTVFRIDPATHAETILHSFRGGPNGEAPEAAVTAIGRVLYGTTSFGGVGCNGAGCGTVFRVAQ